MIHVYKEDRPWGHFERFTKDVPSTVKIITVIHGQSLSLQYHERRQEFWKVLQGNPVLTIGDKEISAKPGDEFFVDKRVKHRIAAKNNNVVVLEIALGRFDESDVVRLEDKYGRVSKKQIEFLNIFKRYDSNPILLPLENSPWQNKAVFNPASIRIDGVTHLLYRAMGEDNTSVIGHATTKDGFTILNRSENPAYTPKETFEMKSKPGNSGCEDPRLTQIDEKIYMTYTAYNGVDVPRAAMTSILVKDFIEQRWNWSKSFLVTPPKIDDKDACLFPEKIDGKNYLIHRMNFAICLDPIPSLGSNSFVDTVTPIIGPRPGMWDSKKVGLSCTPIKTSKGWLTLYHGIDSSGIYRMGAVLLDLKDPHRVVARTDKYLFEPQMLYEQKGQVNNVVFPCGAVVEGDTIFIYYGAADTSTAVATASMKDLMSSFNN